MILKKHAYARAGLLGNPSDGYYGKTISIIVKNYRASVIMYESPELHIELSARDKCTFGNLAQLRREIKTFGYYAGLRLLKATIKKFSDHCDEQGIKIPNRNFSVRYSSNIPRHVGLAGSSAIITAFLRGLCEFYEVEIPKPVQPNIILSVETDELGISAGLQDRVIQTYEGCVYMDFDRELLEKQGHGYYEPIDTALLPPLFIAYRTDLGEGSEVFHNNVRQRWNKGDAEVIAAMKDFASYAEEGRKCLQEGRPREIGPLMDANFNRRRTIYEITQRNLEMIEIGRSHGAHVKYSGSGGAVIGCYEDQEMFENLERAYSEKGYRIFKPKMV